jgi:CheY-like chemotaxis protein
MEAEEWEQALEYLEEVQRLRPGYGETKKLLTRVRSELEREPEAQTFIKELVARRAERLASIIQGAQVLLVNDSPHQMQLVVGALQSLRVQVDVAQTTEQALTLMTSRAYDVIVSDMRRGDVKDEGLRFLNETIKRGIDRPTIFTVGQLDPERGVPPHAFGITNRAPELLNLVFDALDRVRG